MFHLSKKKAVFCFGLIILLNATFVVSFLVSGRAKRVYVNWKVAESRPIAEEPRASILYPKQSDLLTVQNFRDKIGTFLRRNVFQTQGHLISNLSGYNDWHFIAEVLQMATLPPDFYTDCIPAITDFKDQLAAFNIELILLSLPCKWEIHPEGVLGSNLSLPSKVPLNPQRAAFIEALRMTGVEVIDLGIPLRDYRESNPNESLFYKYDHHWSPKGAEVAAAAIAHQIKGRLHQPDEAQKPSLSANQVSVVTGKTLDPPHPEKVHVRAIEGFRSDRESALVLLGDSFSFDHGQTHTADQPITCGFPAQLSYELNLPVDCISFAGGGGSGTAARQEFARRSANETNYLPAKRIVLWELCPCTFIHRDRYIKKIEIVSASSNTNPLSLDLVKGTIRSISRVDPAKMATYRHGVQAILIDLHGKKESAIIFRWVVRDGKHVSDPLGGDLTLGEEWSVNVQDWSKARADNRILRSSYIFDDTDDLTSPTYWAIPFDQSNPKLPR